MNAGRNFLGSVGGSRPRAAFLETPSRHAASAERPALASLHAHATMSPPPGTALRRWPKTGRQARPCSGHPGASTHAERRHGRGSRIAARTHELPSEGPSRCASSDPRPDVESRTASTPVESGLQSPRLACPGPCTRALSPEADARNGSASRRSAASAPRENAGRTAVETCREMRVASRRESRQCPRGSNVLSHPSVRSWRLNRNFPAYPGTLSGLPPMDWTRRRPHLALTSSGRGRGRIATPRGTSLSPTPGQTTLDLESVR